MRGFQRSRTIESLVAEAQTLEAQGVSELVLISQDTTRYGEDLGMKRGGLARLVEALLAGTAFPWIRFLYAYPKTLDDSVLELMAREPRFVPYVDIPLQHVSRPILSAMRRGGDPASYLAMIERMRDTVSDIAIRTTFILGFPGEGEAEFAELCEFVRRAEFDNLGAFTYSPEPGSKSEPLGDPVPAEEKERRRDFLLSLQRPIARAKGRALRGRTVEAIVEGACDETEDLLEGRLRSQAPEIDGRLLINDTGGRDLRPGDIVNVRISETHEYDVVGGVVASGEAVTVRISWLSREAESLHVIRDPLRATDLPRGGVVTIGNFDGVHLGPPPDPRGGRRPRRRGGAAVGRHHVRAAPARRPAAGPRAAADPDAAPEGGGDRGARHRVSPRHPVHAGLLADRAGRVRPGLPRREARRLGARPRAPFRLRARQAGRPRAPEAARARSAASSRRASRK